MRDYINTYKVRVRLLLMLAAVLLSACSDDSDSVEEKKDMLQLVPYSQKMADVTLSATRAVTYDTDDYSLYYGPNSIRVYTISKKEDNTWDVPAQDDIRSFTYKNGSWNSSVSVVNGKDYYIYGFMPVAFKTSSSEPETISSEPATITIKCDVTSENFANGATLTFSDLPPVMAEDFSVVTGVKQVSSANPTESVNLEAGFFSYEGKPTGSNFVCLMLDHLYSCVSFKFLVDKDYSKLRTIKLKKVELKTNTQITYPLTITLRQKPEPVPSGYEPYTIEWGNQTSKSNDYVPLFTSEEGELLPMINDKTVDGYFAPFQDDIANALVLRCTYDVYDKNVTTEHPDGNLVRANCVAENKLPENRVIAGVNQRTLLTITVNPTYLYVLSEPDLDNPTMVVE